MKKLTLLVAAILSFVTIAVNAQNKKVVLITGSASGFGKATAEKLVEKGYIVYGADIQVEKNKYLDKIGGHSIVMDVTKDEEVNAGVDRVIKEQGRIDVLINNAGYGSYATIENIPMEELKYQFDVNVFGYARLQKAVLPHMRKQKSGRIIVTSSVVGHVSTAFTGWYSATKHAVEAMADALRMEVKSLGIDVVKIQPGAVKTGFDDVAWQKLEKAGTAEDYKELEEQFVAAMKDIYSECEGPDDTAEIIVKAVEKRKPKTSYRTTSDAKMMVCMEDILGEKSFDNMMLSAYKRGKKKADKKAEKAAKKNK